VAVHHITVTLGTGNTVIASTSTNCWYVRIESENGNADVKVGDTNLSATNYGGLVVANPTTTISTAMILQAVGNATINLNSIYLLGTSTQKVHVLYIT